LYFLLLVRRGEGFESFFRNSTKEMDLMGSRWAYSFGYTSSSCPKYLSFSSISFASSFDSSASSSFSSSSSASSSYPCALDTGSLGGGRIPLPGWDNFGLGFFAYSFSISYIFLRFSIFIVSSKFPTNSYMLLPNMGGPSCGDLV